MAYSNPAARLGSGTTDLVTKGLYGLERISNDYGLLNALYRGSWIVRKVVDVMAEDMLKDFPRITSEIDPDAIKKFEKVINETATESKMLEALKWGRLFGGAVAIIAIKGVGLKDLETPLKVDDVDLDSYCGLIPLDRWTGVSPDYELITDIENAAEFGLPKYYTCELGSVSNIVRVHHSRVLRFIGRDLPKMESQYQTYWGMSEVELIWDEIRKRDFASWSSANLLARACIWALKDPELAMLMSGLGGSNEAYTKHVQRLQAISEAMSNQGLLPLPKDGELQAHQQSFGGIADLLNVFMLDIAGATEYPVSKLFGRTVTGLGQTGEGDLQNYYDTIEQKRKRELRPQMDKLFPIIAMSTWGKVPDDLDYHFPPVRTLSDKDKSDLAKSNSDAVIAAFNAQIIGRQTALKELKQQADVTGCFSNITDEEIQAADNEVAPQMGEMDPFGETEPDEQPKSKAARDSASVKRVDFAGLPLGIEYPAGTWRILKNPAGNTVYKKLLQHDYGFIEGTVGRDGDEIDVILGLDADSRSVFVVNMKDYGPDPDKREDEDKVLIGFSNWRDAEAAFYGMYPKHFFGGMEELSLDEFRKRIVVPQAA